jgi:hypothetical protein
MIADQFRVRAGELSRAAHSVADLEHKLVLLDAAARWQRLADELDTIDPQHGLR